MSKPKSLTELAMRHKREAYVERICKNPPVLAPMWEREAAKLLTLPDPPDVGPGGEVVRTHSVPDGHVDDAQKDRGFKRANIRDTLAEGATRIAEDASIRRTDLLMQPSFDAVALGIDAADSIGAANSLEKMLAHQMAVAHEASMRLMDRALSYEATDGQCARRLSRGVPTDERGRAADVGLSGCDAHAATSCGPAAIRP